MSEAPTLGTLVVIFIKGRNLPNKRTLGKQNPYCIARIGHDAKRSPSDHRGGQTPTWDSEVRFIVNDTPEHRQLKLSVLDENDAKPELIGDTVIQLDNAFKTHPSRGYDEWHELTLKGKYAGEVYLEMTFYPSRPLIPPKKTKKKVRKSQSVHALPQEPQQSARPLPVQPGSVSSTSTASTASIPNYSNPPSMNMPEIPGFENLSLDHRPDSYAQYPQPPVHYIRRAPLPQPPIGAAPLHHPRPHSTPASLPVEQMETQYEYYSPSNPIPPPPPPASVPLDPSSPGKIRRKPVGSGQLPPIQHEFDPTMSIQEEMPFDANSYNVQAHSRLPAVPSSPPKDVLKANSYAAEPVLRSQYPRTMAAQVSMALPVEPGAGGYAGEGNWNVDQINAGFNDSILNKVLKGHHPSMNNANGHAAAALPPLPRVPHNGAAAAAQAKPKLPPKIPMGMTREEFHATQPIDEEEEDPYYYRVHA